jgi:hypothetical protein
VVYTPVNNSGQQGERGTLTITSNASSAPSMLLQGASGFLNFDPTSTALAVAPGQSVSTSVNVTSYGYIPALTAQLACTGLPANATCSFSPTSFSMPAILGNGNANANFTVTIATEAPGTGSLRRPDLGSGVVAMAALLILLTRSRRKLPASLVLLCIFFCALSGCSSTSTSGGGSGSGGGGGGGGASTGGTPAGTYTVTVTASVQGATPMTQALTLEVQ